MKQDKVRTKRNKARKEVAKNAVKIYLKENTIEKLKKAVSLIDKLAKKRVIHKNKAARLKSRLSRKLKK